MKCAKSGPAGIRTPDLRVRNPTRYPGYATGPQSHCTSRLRRVHANYVRDVVYALPCLRRSVPRQAIAFVRPIERTRVSDPLAPHRSIRCQATPRAPAGFSGRVEPGREWGRGDSNPQPSGLSAHIRPKVLHRLPSALQSRSELWSPTLCQVELRPLGKTYPLRSV